MNYVNFDAADWWRLWNNLSSSSSARDNLYLYKLDKHMKQPRRVLLLLSHNKASAKILHFTPEFDTLPYQVAELTAEQLI